MNMDVLICWRTKETTKAQVRANGEPSAFSDSTTQLYRHTESLHFLHFVGFLRTRTFQ